MSFSLQGCRHFCSLSLLELSLKISHFTLYGKWHYFWTPLLTLYSNVIIWYWYTYDPSILWILDVYRQACDVKLFRHYAYVFLLACFLAFSVWNYIYKIFLVRYWFCRVSYVYNVSDWFVSCVHIAHKSKEWCEVVNTREGSSFDPNQILLPFFSYFLFVVLWNFPWFCL